MIVFLSPFASFDERLEALGSTTTRSWDDRGSNVRLTTWLPR